LISTKFAALASLVFAALCLWFALDGFTSIPDNADPEQVSGGRSFAWFWSFLTVVGLAMAWLMWKLAEIQERDKDA
jgi:hypothetical protein